MRRFKLITDGTYREINPKCPKAGDVLEYHSDRFDIGYHLKVSTDIVTRGYLYYSKNDVEEIIEQPKKAMAISHTVYPLDYNKNNPTCTEQFNSIAKHHRDELTKIYASSSEQLMRLCSEAGEEMNSLLDQAQELIATNYKRR